jgi:hypothetical protein
VATNSERVPATTDALENITAKFILPRKLLPLQVFVLRNNFTRSLKYPRMKRFTEQLKKEISKSVTDLCPDWTSIENSNFRIQQPMFVSVYKIPKISQFDGRKYYCAFQRFHDGSSRFMVSLFWAQDEFPDLDIIPIESANGITGYKYGCINVGSRKVFRWPAAVDLELRGEGKCSAHRPMSGGQCRENHT